MSQNIQIQVCWVKSDISIGSNVGNNDNDIKLKVCDHASISKYKNIFAKVCTQNLSEEVFLLKKVKINLAWASVIENLMVNK